MHPQKYRSITWLRAIACLLILNTHSEMLFPERISMLAFGGLFGNCIFFIVSGFCLYAPKERFGKWYAHRLLRIYVPYLLFLPMLYFAGMLSHLTWLQVLIPYVDYHFLVTIMGLYPVLYLLLYLDRRTRFTLKWQITALLVIQLTEYLLVFDYKNVSSLEHFSVPETLTYLLTMLMGVAVRKETENGGLRFRGRAFVGYGMTAALSLGGYVLLTLCPPTGALRILQNYDGIVFSFSLCMLLIMCEARLPRVRLAELLASVTLESYLVLFVSRKAFAPIGFPTGLIYYVISTIGMAICLHWVSTWILRRIERKKGLSAIRQAAVKETYFHGCPSLINR